MATLVCTCANDFKTGVNNILSICKIFFFDERISKSRFSGRFSSNRSVITHNHRYFAQLFDSIIFLDEDKSNRKKKSKEQKRLEEMVFLSKLFPFFCQIISDR